MYRKISLFLNKNPLQTPLFLNKILILRKFFTKNTLNMNFKIFLLALLFSVGLSAQNIQNNPKSNHGNKFEQLGTILPTPNVYRTGSGAPGQGYWQNRADYDITAFLDEDKRNLRGSETIVYYNNSPDDLEYLWLQLDENEQSTVKNAAFDDSSFLPKLRQSKNFRITRKK